MYLIDDQPVPTCYHHEADARIVLGQTRLKLILDKIDMIYSDRGMPFVSKLSSLEGWEAPQAQKSS